MTTATVTIRYEDTGETEIYIVPSSTWYEGQQVTGKGRDAIVIDVVGGNAVEYEAAKFLEEPCSLLTPSDHKFLAGMNVRWDE